jgi:predicted Zn-dependent protease
MILAIAFAAISLVTYLSSRQENPYTGETQFVQISTDQEIALGLQSAPEMMAQHGGELRDPVVQQRIDRIGRRLVESSGAAETPYPFDFHVLADPQTINAFALPGGQVFITRALLERLETEGQIAGVLGHEIGHVVARHSAQRLAQMQLTQGLTGAAVLATYDPADPNSRNTAAIAMLIGQVVNMHYGRDDELQSDQLGVSFLAAAGYDPRAMLRVMEILAEAGGGAARPPEFFSTHPNPENRIQRIQDRIHELFPDSVPSDLVP